MEQNTIFETLMTAYQERVASQVALQDALNTELSQIGKDNLPAVIEARLQILSRELQEAVAGRDALQVERVEAAITRAKDELEGHQKHIEALQIEAALIPSQLERIANEVMGENYPGIAEQSCRRWERMVEETDSVWEALTRFSNETKARLTTSTHQCLLVPTDHGEMRHIYRRLHEWV